MKKFTKTTLALLAIVASSVLTASAGEGESHRIVKITPESNGKIKFTYLNDGNCNVIVKIVNDHGIEIFSNKIKSDKSFTIPYNFKGMSTGSYTFKIIDANGMISKTIDLPSSVKTSAVLAKIKKTDDAKFEVTVLGDHSNPIYINIYDWRGERIFGDYIDLTNSFTKTYDLSRLSVGNVLFEVINDERVIAKTKF